MNGWSVVARKRPFLLGVLHLAAVMIAPHVASGQSSTAILEGTVRSQPGVPVAGAEATGQGVRAVTDAQGRVVRVQLAGLSRASGLDPALFELKDPRPKNVGRGKV